MSSSAGDWQGRPCCHPPLDERSFTVDAVLLLKQIIMDARTGCVSEASASMQASISTGRHRPACAESKPTADEDRAPSHGQENPLTNLQCGISLPDADRHSRPIKRQGERVMNEWQGFDGLTSRTRFSNIRNVRCEGAWHDSL